MNISLTSELESFVKTKVATGMYTSNSEVMREALRLMEERDALKLESLRHDINQGLSSIEKGRIKPLDINALKAKGRAQLKGNAR
ncbi:MAG TPA: type II toxin-antitoxin system ParD family antitoxin [Gammaproteobacteria bacterium]|nr:type II toxin-antitoxin system ParD family antitoxin [Gammaproteobacteria bacterium]